MNKETFNKIISKKEFSRLPKKDVELAWEHFEKREVSDTEKIRLTRELLHKVFASFTSSKLLSPKNKDAEWILRKHLSTRERMGDYSELYLRLLAGIEGNINILDLGCGVNGFSYKYFEKKVNYLGIESMGQLVDLMNEYFKRDKLSAKAVHLSLFDLEKVLRLVKQMSKPRAVFLFKVIDGLEMMERDYSKKLISELVKVSDRVVVSFATRSMISRKRFKVDRSWILNFIKDNFNIRDDFELGGERYLVFEKK